MKKIQPILLAAFICLCLTTACEQNGNTTQGSAFKPVTDSMASMPGMADTAPKYTLAMVVNKRDLTCGMPLTAGLEDTAHYKGKAYGFCSKECKDEFLKNPDAHIARMKK